MKHLIVGNWKMEPATPQEAKVLFTTVKDTVTRLRHVEAVIAPPALFIPLLMLGYAGNKVGIAGQCMSLFEGGAHTGEISAEHLQKSGARFVLIEHSERGSSDRERFEHLRIKTFLALKYALTPIVFIGERTRDSMGAYLERIREEIQETLREIPESRRAEVIFCYEPVWAIGQAEAIDTYDIHQMALFIRKVLLESYNTTLSHDTKVLYGGSVNEDTIADILSIGDLDGVVVGRASVESETFINLLKIANKVV